MEAERDCRDLYCLASTARCAAGGCVHCAYKVCQKSSPLTTLPPNWRPELCGRSGSEGASLFAGCRVLTVGDGDLSFSVALRRAGVRVVATTLAESLDDLERRYPKSPVRVFFRELEEEEEGNVVFGVDATKPPKFADLYDRVVFNFPCVDVPRGKDGQNPESGVADSVAVERNRDLVRAFARAAVDGFLAPAGEILVSHKTKPPFSWWRVPDVVCEGTGLELRGAIVFDRASFAPYKNRKAMDNASFPAHDALTYVFSLPISPLEVGMQPPSTLPRAPAPSSRDETSPVPTPFSPPVGRARLKTLLASPVDARGLLLEVSPDLLAALRLAAATTKATITTKPASKKRRRKKYE
ncbi:hypothetical protein CTAYLR_005984 [Chrysophaeum taylorii]|uniref:25S rRNA (uridine-N(3))-methyltransferase BMT5-like domain-containing protein n=1 Tax=Chrysophaeum taylorii TaxID=2483200 RepID=A0AAD7U725_9STRA|nr:hypothetical protein CTAYLR_005984 [Chrysophaeum taylorii]